MTRKQCSSPGCTNLSVKGRSKCHSHRNSSARKVRALIASRRGTECDWPGCARLGVEWSHCNPEEKLFNISMGRNHSVSKVKAEISKCKWTCIGHHRLMEAYYFLGLVLPWDSKWEVNA